MRGGAAVGTSSGVPTVFFGSGTFAVPVLDGLVAAPGVRLVGVVTAPPRPAGRGERVRRSPVALRAAELDVGPVLAPPRLRAPEGVESVVALRSELIVLADYGQIVPRAILQVPVHGALNLHPSLLPRHRGASPVQAAIMAGDRETGVTLMLMGEGLDTGPIVAQEAFPLVGDETAPLLEVALAGVAARLLAAILPGWIAGARAARPQPEEGATLTRPLRRADGLFDPSRSARELERQVRAYQPWPGTFADSVAGRIIIWAARPLTVTGPTTRPDSLGTIVPDDVGLAVLVSDGALRLEEVQLAGGRRMTSAELRRGHPELIGSRLPSAALP